MMSIPSIRRALPLVGLFASAAAASAQAPLATATVTYRTDAVRGYRQGDDFLLPLANLSALGWSAIRAGNKVRLSADDRLITLPVRRVGANECVSLKAVAREFGAIGEWTSGFDSYRVLATIQSVVARDGTLQASAKMAISPRVRILSSPARAVVDLEGAMLPRGAKLDLDPGVTVEPFGPTTVRINYPLSNPSFIGAETPGTDLKLSLALPPAETPPPTPAGGTAAEAPGVAPSSAPVELALRSEIEGPVATLLTLNAPTAALRGKPVVRKPMPDVLEIVLPGVVAAFPEGFAPPSSAIRNVSTTLAGDSTVVRFELASPMGGEVWTDARGVVIQLQRPAIANGSIAGKVIVVDAGHGGRDSGATAAGVSEKRLTLAIAKYLSAELGSLGATVLMTRKDDSYPSLDARPQLANRNRADLFVSVHINSPGGRGNGPSGSQVYYHGNDGTSRLMAECIMKYMVSGARMNNLGVKSDSVLYRSGLAVLRGSKVPAVLVEVGFITNPSDRARMLRSDFQATTARAIATGLRLFLGDKP